MPKIKESNSPQKAIPLNVALTLQQHPFTQETPAMHLLDIEEAFPGVWLK
jgi:hypothetical protein